MAKKHKTLKRSMIISLIIGSLIAGILILSAYVSPARGLFLEGVFGSGTLFGIIILSGFIFGVLAMSLIVGTLWGVGLEQMKGQI